MISINTLKIDELASKFIVDINTTPGEKITKVLLWDSYTYKDYSKAIDVSYLLTQQSEKESFSIFAKEQLEKDKITGLWFIEFESTVVLETGKNETRLGVASNFIPYYECTLNKILPMKLDGCKPVFDNECDECDGNVLYISSLILVLQEAVKFGFFEEAVKMIDTLDDLCEICKDCPDYGATLLINGLGFGTIDNSIILI